MVGGIEPPTYAPFEGLLCRLSYTILELYMWKLIPSHSA